MSVEQNKALVRRFIDAIFVRKQLAALDTLLDPHYVDHFLTPDFAPGLEGNKQYFSMLFGAFPDLEYTVEDMIAEGDLVVSRDLVCASHQGDYRGIAATGRRVRFTGICIVRIKENKLVEHWHEVDRLSLLQQLGVIPMLR